MARHLSSISPDRAEAIDAAIKVRDEWFASLSPDRQEEALALQAKIDERLRKAGNQNNRLTTINDLMMESFHEMREALNGLLGSIPE